MSVELVAVERRVWSGTANMLVVQTTEGELGVLPGHEPLLGELVDGGVVRIIRDDGSVSAAVHGGFLSVTSEKVSILAEAAELDAEIDVGRAKQALQRAENASDDEEAPAAKARASARLRAAEQA